MRKRDMQKEIDRLTDELRIVRQNAILARSEADRLKNGPLAKRQAAEQAKLDTSLNQARMHEVKRLIASARMSGVPVCISCALQTSPGQGPTAEQTEAAREQLARDDAPEPAKPRRRGLARRRR